MKRSAGVKSVDAGSINFGSNQALPATNLFDTLSSKSLFPRWNLILIIASGVGLFVFLLAIGSELFSRYLRAKLRPSGEFIRVGENEIHFVQEGNGRSLLLIHGLTGSAQNFTYSLSRELAKYYQVIALDRPGSGHSPRKLFADASLKSQAATIAHFIRLKNLDRPYIVGHSLGGAIALQLALDYPDLVEGLALIAPLTQVLDKVPQPFGGLAIRSRILRLIHARTLATALGIFGGKKKAAFVFAPEEMPNDFGIRGGGFLSADWIGYFNGSSDLTSLEKNLDLLAARYAELKLPVAILYGKDDHVLDYRLHGLSMKTFGANFKVEVISGGHMIVATEPRLVSDFILTAERALRGQNNDV